MLKEAPFVNGKYKKGYLVCQKCYVKGLSGWTQGGASPYKCFHFRIGLKNFQTKTF